jgi:hypothetical protein
MKWRPGGPFHPRGKWAGAVVRIDDADGKNATVSIGYMNRLKRQLHAVTNPGMTASKVKTLADMTPEEKAALEQRYNAKIRE